MSPEDPCAYSIHDVRCRGTHGECPMSPRLFPWATVAAQLPEQSHGWQLHLPHRPQPIPMHWGLGFTVPRRVGCAPSPAAPGLRQPWDELFQRQQKQRRG